MNTTAAALEAHVTVDTIRTWARNGVITATKNAGRWVIDTASLARRIAIGAMKRPTKPATVAFTADTMVAIGGSRWRNSGTDRVYINGWHTYLGLHVETRRSGSISHATLNGETISNTDARRFADAVRKVFWDSATGEITVQWGSGTPYQMNRQEIVAALNSGIRAAIAAL